MQERALAAGLLQMIAAPYGAASVSIWYDAAAPYFKVYLAEHVLSLKARIPDSFEGYEVSVEAMPAFQSL